MARKGYKTATFKLPDGTRKYVYAKTQEELDQKVFDLKLQMKMGVDLNDRTTVGELLKLWFDTEVAPNVGIRAADVVRRALNLHLMPMAAGAVAKEVTPVQVKMWLNHTSKLNQQYARTCFRALRESFALAEENGLILKSPVLSRYRPGGWSGAPKKALTPTEEDQLLRVLAGTRAHLLVWFLLATGARRGEACGLLWDCVDLDKGEIHLRRNLVTHPDGTSELHDYLKTEASTRTVPLPPDLCDALRAERRRAMSVYVFTAKGGAYYDADRLKSMWGLVTRRFGPDAYDTKRIKGVKTNTKVTPHILRHTYATRCFEAGMDIKEVQMLMGHASPDVTLRVYTHYCQESRQEATFEKARTARTRTTLVPQTGVKNELKKVENV